MLWPPVTVAVAVGGHESSLVGNFSGVADDYHGVNCERCRETLSARLDGEVLSDAADAVADDHVSQCEACRQWLTGATALHRAVRIAPADEIPDLTAAILAAAPSAARRRRQENLWPRLALATVGVAQLGLAIPALVFGADVAASLHVAHELASWEVALSIGFLFAAARPARAWGMLPLVAALVACLLATTAVDMSDGRAGALSETTHALEVTGLFFLFMLAGVRPSRRGGLRTA